ncbi:MAG: insulinase family protein [Clostridia bacterium]|nr:insulinase family protein [Clostridia bacterium]
MMEIKFDIFESPSPREKYYRYRHPCGLDIYVFPKKLSSAYAILGTRYGSIDNVFGTEEGKELTTVPDGIAHFLEHKLFANEDGSDSTEVFSALGADANAYTSFNRTAYLFSSTENFDAALAELIDFVYHPYFTDESVKRECGIIGQEIGMYDDSPAESCYYGMLGGLYEKHSIKRNICGSVESISQITPELLYECHRVFYDPSNMALIVCGDFSPEGVIAVANEHLPTEAKGVKIIRSEENLTEAPSAFLQRVEKRMRVSKPMFNIGIKDTDIPSNPLERQKKDAAMSILNEILFARAGRLYSDMFESGLISPEMSYCYSICSSFAFNSIAGESDDPEAVFAKIKDYLSEVAKEGLSREDFERGKRVMYAEFVKEFDSTEGIANNLFSFICEGADLFEYANLILDVSFEQVEELFKKSFKDEFFTMSVVYPINN